MKKISTIIFLFALIFVLTGCEKEQPDQLQQPGGLGAVEQAQEPVDEVKKSPKLPSLPEREDLNEEQKEAMGVIQQLLERASEEGASEDGIPGEDQPDFAGGVEITEPESIPEPTPEEQEEARGLIQDLLTQPTTKEPAPTIELTEEEKAEQQELINKLLGGEQ